MKKKIEKFEKQFNAKVSETGRVVPSYHYDFGGISYDRRHDAFDDKYYVEKEYKIVLSDQDLYNLMDFVDWSANQRNTFIYYGSDSTEPDPSEKKYYREIMRERYEDEKCRKMYPALQDAWEQYQAMKLLLTK